MIFLTQEASRIPMVWEIAANARFTINDIWHDLPENILIATTKIKSLHDICEANQHEVLIKLSEDYIRDPTGLYDTLSHELLHACIGCQNEDSRHHKGEWLRRAKYLHLEV